MEELIKQLKEQIIEALNLEEMTPDDIDNEAALFASPSEAEEGLGLDSIDALELIVLLEKNYGIRLANPAEGKAIFKNIATIADYVSKNRKK
jgi:acyl carrier protein